MPEQTKANNPSALDTTVHAAPRPPTCGVCNRNREYTSYVLPSTLSNTSTDQRSALTSGGLDGSKKLREDTPDTGRLCPPMGLAERNTPSRRVPPTGYGSIIQHPPCPTAKSNAAGTTFPVVLVGTHNSTLPHLFILTKSHPPQTWILLPYPHFCTSAQSFNIRPLLYPRGRQ